MVQEGTQREPETPSATPLRQMGMRQCTPPTALAHPSFMTLAPSTSKAFNRLHQIPGHTLLKLLGRVSKAQAH